MLQASFSIVDQIMSGQLGSVSVAGVGLAGKFTSIYSVTVSAIGAVAGIMIAQYLGQKNKQEVRRSFYLNLVFAVGLVVLFTAFCMLFPTQIMGIYTKDGKTKYVMVIDIIGTWVFGVPLGLVTAFVLNLSIPYVYFILSLEECVRFAISVVVFRKRKWMQSLDSE